MVPIVAGEGGEVHGINNERGELAMHLGRDATSWVVAQRVPLAQRVINQRTLRTPLHKIYPRTHGTFDRGIISVVPYPPGLKVALGFGRQRTSPRCAS